MARRQTYPQSLTRGDRTFSMDEPCALCGYAWINVRHVTDRKNAPEGEAYYADVTFCRFEPVVPRR